MTPNHYRSNAQSSRYDNGYGNTSALAVVSPERGLRAIEYDTKNHLVKQEPSSSPPPPAPPPLQTFNPIRYLYTCIVLFAFGYLLTQLVFNGTRDERELPSGRELHLSLTKYHKWHGAVFFVKEEIDMRTTMDLRTWRWRPWSKKRVLCSMLIDELNSGAPFCSIPTRLDHDNSRFFECYAKTIENLVRERKMNVFITNEAFKNKHQLVFSATKRILSNLSKTDTNGLPLPKLYTLRTPNLVSKFVGPFAPFLTKCERVADSVIYVVEYAIILFSEHFSVGSGSSHRRWAHANRLAKETPLSPMLVYMSSWYDWWDTVEKAWRSIGFRWTAGLHLVFSRYMWVNELVEEVL
ncbi:N-acetylglucosaminyl-phosphatidylinositol de-N-acetylase [Paramarasmius palmivorus]|uniref:N-acetylglucosaminyl-phosphatidylinositol de-N-acetylase n=1 Tax=Paramarasmius palmivorus TaxID=297713 RepID=A0AAW0BKJ0_9AGAR